MYACSPPARASARARAPTKPFPSHSVPSLSRTSPRERRTVALGVAVSAAALLVAYGAAPFVRHWRAREEVIASQTDRLARLRGLVGSEAALRATVEQRSALLAAGRQRLLAGRTPALAGSALQSALQRYADESGMTVSRLDVAGAPMEGGVLPRLPATVSVVGDLYGLVDLLERVQHGPLALEITELTVRPNPALRGEPLQVTIALRGAFAGG
ncbi:MAG: hypothetical protein EXR95_07490 [Gemmatimonadetes bacterium]|nr:hypothetical protein [Gemmatimonadota bacterium]